jgi:hypothetical protein
MRIRRTDPPGTVPTRVFLFGGAALAAGAAALVLAGRPRVAAIAAAPAAAALLLGGHRANHGAGGPTDRTLDALLDRAWDGAILGSIAWATRDPSPRVAAGALVALGASFLSSYVRARGAALGYTVEERHVTRGVRYALVVLGLATRTLGVMLWAAAGVSILTALVRTGQVAKEERP